MTKSKLTPKVKKNSISLADTLIWLLIIAVFIVALVANYVYFQGVSAYIRAAAWIVLALIFVGLASLTKRGKAVLTFSKEARAELRKVHWPNRQETVQTTLMVIVMVIIVGIFLWAIDTLFLWAVNWLTNLKG